MQKILKPILGVIGVLLLIGIGFVFYLNQYTDSHETIEINEVNISTLSDGVYTGSFSQGRWRNILEVTVKNGEIIKIITKKSVIFEKDKVSNKLFESVIQEQKVKVDTVSGATITSKAYLKSIENALSQKK